MKPPSHHRHLRKRRWQWVAISVSGDDNEMGVSFICSSPSFDLRITIPLHPGVTCYYNWWHDSLDTKDERCHQSLDTKWAHNEYYDLNSLMSLLLLVFAVTTVHFVGNVMHSLVLACFSCSRFGVSLTCDDFMVLSCLHVFYWSSCQFSKCIAHSNFY